MNIKLITFDLDNTLWRTEEALLFAEKKLSQWILLNALKVNSNWNNILQEEKNSILRRNPKMKYRLTALRKKSLFRMFIFFGYSYKEAWCLTGKAFLFFLTYRNQVSLYPSVHYVLSFLSKKFILGSITNGNANLKAIGLDRYFSFNLSADKYGIGKPNSFLFKKALLLGKANPVHSVHIGDHPIDDVLGALNIGMNAIWFNPDNMSWIKRKRPTRTISNLLELPKIFNPVYL